MVLAGIRSMRIGVQIHGEHVAIRGFVRTRRLNVSQIREITLEPEMRSFDSGWANVWAPCFHLTDGSSIRVEYGLGQTGRLDKPAPEKIRHIVKDIRWHLGIDQPTQSHDQ